MRIVIKVRIQHTHISFIILQYMQSAQMILKKLKIRTNFFTLREKF